MNQKIVTFAALKKAMQQWLPHTANADKVTTDADVLRCYCEAVSRYAQAAELYARSSPIITSIVTATHHPTTVDPATSGVSMRSASR